LLNQVVPVRDVDKKRWLLAGERRKRRLNFRYSTLVHVPIRVATSRAINCA
jgi:hypothetical protein